MDHLDLRNLADPRTLQQNLSISCESATVFKPHVLGIFALNVFVVLLPGIALEVVKIAFVETIAILYTKVQEFVQVVMNG
jgi:hypothetical protein